MKKVLIIAAHPDDAEFGMGGTLARLAETCEVTLCILCKGDRPGVAESQSSRENALRANVKQLKIKQLFHNNFCDVSLDTIAFATISAYLTDIVDKVKPDTVFTNYKNDIHIDHRIVSAATRVACRPRKSCSVTTLYEYPIAGSAEWGFEGIVYNTFFNIQNYTMLKYICIGRYKSEMKNSPDPLSIDSLKARDTYYGSLAGYDVAEAFICIFNKI